MNAGRGLPWGWWWWSCKPIERKPRVALYGYEIYTPPPKLFRYVLERWSYEDVLSQREAGETYAPIYCVACAGFEGDFYPGEYVVDDSLSIDFLHIRCAPRSMRARAWLGTLVCTLLAVLGIDRFSKKVVHS